MCRRSSRIDGRKTKAVTKAVRTLRRQSTHTNSRETKGSGMDMLMKLTIPESREDKRTAIARIRRTLRQEGQVSHNVKFFI